MAEFKTVEEHYTSSDALAQKQKQDVAEMRASLLACSDDPTTVVPAMKKITVLRVIHQMCRIIRYLDIMDRIEDKLYAAIDDTLINLESEDPTTWVALLNMQDRLMHNMIDSHKLLEPYLSIQEMGMMDMAVSAVTVPEEHGSIISREARENLRMNAQNVLALLERKSIGESE